MAKEPTDAPSKGYGKMAALGAAIVAFFAGLGVVLTGAQNTIEFISAHNPFRCNCPAVAAVEPFVPTDLGISDADSRFEAHDQHVSLIAHMIVTKTGSNELDGCRPQIQIGRAEYSGLTTTNILLNKGSVQTEVTGSFDVAPSAIIGAILNMAENKQSTIANDPSTLRARLNCPTKLSAWSDLGVDQDNLQRCFHAIDVRGQPEGFDTCVISELQHKP